MPSRCGCYGTCDSAASPLPCPACCGLGGWGGRWGDAGGRPWRLRHWPRGRPSCRRSSVPRRPWRAARTPHRPPSWRSDRGPGRDSRRRTSSGSNGAVNDSTSISAIFDLTVGDTRPRRDRSSSSTDSAGHDLVGIGQRRHDQPDLDGADRRRVLAGAHHEPGDGHLAVDFNRPRQQHVRLRVEGGASSTSSRRRPDRSGPARRTR